MGQKIWLETVVENELSNIKKRDLESHFELLDLGKLRNLICDRMIFK